jgi:hypothetical protein
MNAPLVQQFLVGELHSPAICKRFYPLVARHSQLLHEREHKCRLSFRMRRKTRFTQGHLLPATSRYMRVDGSLFAAGNAAAILPAMSQPL